MTNSITPAEALKLIEEHQTEIRIETERRNKLRNEELVRKAQMKEEARIRKCQNLMNNHFNQDVISGIKTMDYGSSEIYLDKKYYGCQIEIFNRGFCVGWPNSRGLPITPNRSESIEDE